MLLNREKILQILESNLDAGIYKHCLALEACMGGLYDYFDAQGQLDSNEPSKEYWLSAGLLHDIDYSGEFKAQHPNKTKEALDKYGLETSDTVIRIIKTHAPKVSGESPQTKAEWSIFCADSLTGLITAVALMLPTKKLADVKLSSVMKRFLHQPRFAAGTRRDEVAQCSNLEGLNLPLEKFVEICLSSMKNVSSEIGF